MAPRVAVVSVYFKLFDAQMPPDFRTRQEAWIKHLAELLGASLDLVAFTGLITSDEEADAAADLLREATPDVVVFVPPMAAPPAFAAKALANTEARRS